MKFIIKNVLKYCNQSNKKNYLKYNIIFSKIFQKYASSKIFYLKLCTF